MKTAEKTALMDRLESGGASLSRETLEKVVSGSEEHAVRTVEVIGAEIKSLLGMARRTTLWCAVEIGRRLCEAKELAGHGGWLVFLREHTEFSERKAQDLMRVYRAYGGQASLFGAELANPQTFADLDFTKAVALLAIEDEGAREAFVEVHDVENMSTRELKEAIKQRDEAVKALQTSESRLADTQRELSLSQQKETDLTERLKKAQEDIAASDTEALAIAENMKKLELQIKELEARPVDVAVMSVDQEKLDKARAEAVAEMQEKLDKAKAKAEKAEEKRKTAEDALAAARGELEAEKQRQAAAVIAGDKELAQFELLFDQMKETVNRLHGLLLLVRSRGDEALTGNLQKALLALSEAVKGAAA